MISMIAGIVSLLLKGKNAEKVCLASLAIITVLSAVLLMYLLPTGGSFVYMMGHYPAPWGNELRAGLFEAIMALTFALVMLLSLLAARKSVFREIPEAKQGLYYLMINLLMASLLALIYTNDIFTAYVFVEINTIAACSIVVAKDTGETVTATIRYLIMSLLGSGFFLIAVTLLYDLTGHLLMPQMHTAIQQLAIHGTYSMPLSVIIILIAVGLAIKSALYPFHGWLPAAHGSANSASSAILSGVVLKGYIILLIKIFYRVIGLDVVHHLGVTNILFVFGLAGMVMGSVNAMRQKNIKRMIAYSSVAQVGYIYMGIGLSTTTGMIAASFHIIAHAVTKPMLFCAAEGLMHVSGHSKQIADLKGSAYRNPLAGIAFAIGTLSMIGIPFFSGFVSKVYFASASLESPEKMIPTLLILALSTILNALYYFPVLLVIYSFEAGRDDLAKIPISINYRLAVLCYMAVNIYLGINYTPIIRILERGLAMF
jgi:multicomponent Na+:H+ antiporter subunit D